MSSWDFGWIPAAANAHPVFGTLMFVSFWWGTLGVDQVEIDPTNRTYFLRRGVWPFTAGFSGTLEDVELRLTESDGRRGCYWIFIKLAWKDNSHLELSLWSKDAHGREALKSIVSEARLHAQKLAEQLQIPLRP